MPLDIPNLDDRSWTQLVEEARTLIPRVAPAWTDHNVHDPGITFIELFAWLAEMQLYQVNRVSERHQEIFARLSGVQRQHRIPARALLRIEGRVAVGSLLAAGTQLIPVGHDELIFETETDVFLTASRLQRVVVSDGTAVVDQTDANERSSVAFLAFGDTAGAGASLQLGFDAFHPAEPELRLTFDLFDDDLVTPCDASQLATVIPPDANVVAVSPVELAWESQTGGGWTPVRVIEDATHGLISSGAVRLSTPQGAVHRDGLMWIRARIARGAYDIEPRVRNVAVNAVPSLQRETVRDEPLSEIRTAEGRPDQAYVLKRKPLMLPGEGLPARFESSDVVDWSLLLDEARRADPELAQRLWNARNAAADPQDAVARGVTELNRDVTRATKAVGMLLGREPIVVTVDDQLWQRVESFEASHPSSPHFVLDVDDGRVLFGNGLNGRIPPKDADIRARWYRTSAGTQGNIAPDQQWRFRAAGVSGVSVRNAAAARGGAGPETLADLALRGQASLRRPTRGVTLRDLERLALATPYVHVARAKAVPNCPQPEAISVVVLPKVRPGRERLRTHISDAFLTQIRRHLERHRLLCDDLRVTRPVFVEVSVSAQLRLIKGASPAAVISRASATLDRFLQGTLDFTREPGEALPSLMSPCPTRWPFGRAVRLSEVYAALERVKGVDTVWDVTIEGRNGSELISRDRAAGIPLPPVGLVVAGAHSLVVEERGRSRR